MTLIREHNTCHIQTALYHSLIAIPADINMSWITASRTTNNKNISTGISQQDEERCSIVMKQHLMCECCVSA